jgi:2-polyprenyl-6-methoxyphenol hydroxylase-like FAD-dependent oxidoreductase
VIDAVKQVARDSIAPSLADLFVASRPYFQAIHDLASPQLVFGRAVIMGDAAFVARPHVGAGVTKAALNAAWLADALAAAPDNIDTGLAAYETRAKSFGSALVERARFIGAYLEDPPRAGLTPDPVSLMHAIGAPLRDIPELAGYFFDGQGAPQGAQAPAKSSGDTARPLDGLVR